MAANRKTHPAEGFQPIKANHTPADANSETPKRKAKPKSTALPQEGFVRLPAILANFPISKSGWYAGVASGRYPKSVKLGPRTTAWRCDDIRNLIANAGISANDATA
jgi:predicted DNA-binding transcriptional regulator AlpA